MNIILLDQNDFQGNEMEVLLTGRRFFHIRQILKSSVGDCLAVGLVNGKLGEGKILELTDKEVRLKFNLTEDPPQAVLCKLILALPRPIVLKRLLASVTTLGIKEIYLIQTSRVQKSYWQSPVLEVSNLEQILKAGLEQAKDTILPKIYFKKKFKSFVEDELPAIVQGTQLLIAHPNSGHASRAAAGPVTLAVGPEGGFVDYEIEKLSALGFKSIHLGQRVLKVETAVTALIAQVCLSGACSENAAENCL